MYDEARFGMLVYMFIALREIFFAKGRFALMSTVIALISLLLIMLSGLTAGLAHQSTSAIAGLPADQIAFDAGEGAEQEASYTRSRVTTSQVHDWKATMGVNEAEPLGITQTLAETTGEKDTSTQITVFGAPLGGFATPDSLASGGIVVSETVAADLGVTADDSLSVAGEIFPISATIPDQWYSHTPVVWMSQDAWKQITPGTSASTVGTVILSQMVDGANTAEVTATANQQANTLSMTPEESFSALASYTSEHGSLTLIQGFLYAICALVVGAFLSVWTVQRTREIAIIRALGASTKRVLSDALFQAAIIVAIGAGTGTGLGLIAGVFASRVAPFSIGIMTTLVPGLGIIASGLVAALVSVRRVIKVNPLLALGGN